MAFKPIIYQADAVEPVVAIPKVILPFSTGGGTAVTNHALNLAWSAAGSRYVPWETTDPDPTGVSWPGPGAFDASTYSLVRTWTT